MTGALVGRHSELQQLVEAFKASRAGGAVTVVIRGEPGIGKSRLLTEALAQAELLGHDVLHGRLDELDRYLPYAAIRAAVWPALAAEHDPELVDAAETVQEGLTALLAGGTERDAVPVHRLFEGLERLLREWCDRRPVVLAIDDLHAADSDTLTLVALLVRHLQTAPIAFVATMRSHPPDVSVELQSAVEQLARDSLASVIELGPLDRDEVRAVARAVVSATPDERLVGALFEAAKGNPFYVEEGVRSLQASGALVVDHDECRLADEAAPPTLSGRSTLVYRLFNLGPAARSVARALTAFRRFDVDHLPLLAAITELDEPTVEDSFDILVNARVLRRDEGYEFVQPVLRATLYEERGAAERRCVNGIIAARLLADRAAGLPVALPDLATHLAVSAAPGDNDAVAVLEEAARAASSSAPASAAAWYTRALELLPAEDARRGALRAEQARTFFLASQFERAADAGRLALELMPPSRARSRTAGVLVASLTIIGAFEEALAQASAVLSASDEPLPRLHAERGMLLAHLHRFAEAEDEARRALDLAGDDDGARALAWGALAGAVHAKGDVAACLEYLGRRSTASEHLGPAARLGALAQRATLLATSGFVRDSDAALAEAGALRDALGGTALRELLEVSATMTDWLAGRWDKALERTRWLSLPPQPAEAWVSLARAADLAIRVARGDYAGARIAYDQLEGERFAPSSALWARALLHEALGELDEAVGLLEAAWEHDMACGRRAELHGVFDRLVGIELDRDNHDAAARWAKEADDVLQASTSPWAQLILDRLHATIDGDVEAGRAAVVRADDAGLVVEAAHCRLTLGELGDEAPANLRAAYETYRDLGAESWRRRVAHAMKAAGLEAPRSRPARHGALNDTEVRLCQLVRDGLTNRQIAHTLLISPKTVEVYLSRLFAKTGCASRLELAVAVSEGRIGAPSESPADA